MMWCVYGKRTDVARRGTFGQVFGHVRVRYFWTYRVHEILKNAERLGENGHTGQVNSF